MFAQCAHVSLSCVIVSILCVSVCLVRTVRRVLRGFGLGQMGGCGTRDTAKEMHSLFRYNKYRGL